MIGRTGWLAQLAEHVTCKPAQWLLDARPTGDQVGGRPLPIRLHSFSEIDHEIFSTVIVSLPLIQEGLLSVPED